MVMLEPVEQARLETLLGWKTFQGGLNNEYSCELRDLVGKQFPKEARGYDLEKLAYLGLGMLAAYAVIRGARP